ncbi:MAG: hypothetical protein WCD88_02240 [Desulfobacterales bacterium]
MNSPQGRKGRRKYIQGNLISMRRRRRFFDRLSVDRRHPSLHKTEGTVKVHFLSTAEKRGLDAGSVESFGGRGRLTVDLFMDYFKSQTGNGGLFMKLSSQIKLLE